MSPATNPAEIAAPTLGHGQFFREQLGMTVHWPAAEICSSEQTLHFLQVIFSAWIQLNKFTVTISERPLPP